jgi:ATP-dependent RNA helicase DbpA
MKSFLDLGIKPALLEAIAEQGYEQPSEIQAKAIPIILKGSDLVGQAETGSGKTAAYAIPLLELIQADHEQVQALILVPTRELVLQVRAEFKKFSRFIPNLKISVAYGGHDFREEKKSFVHPPKILIATPGRLIDHLNRKTLSLKELRHFVIDEADKLLELGFEDQLWDIWHRIPPLHQALLFSATLPESVVNLIRRGLKRPEYLRTQDQATPAQIEQLAIRMGDNEKAVYLSKLLRKINTQSAIIFCNTRERTSEIGQFLQKKGFILEILHGAMDQQDRDKAMMRFRNGSAPLLVATDIAARGIDIQDLGTVIHYEIPHDEASFLHRSGRTARAGKSGKVYSFVNKKEAEKIKSWPNVNIIDWQTIQETMPDMEAKPTVTSELLQPELTTIHIKAGKKEKISARDIVGALIAEAGIDAKTIGKIEIHDHFSYVAIPAKEAKVITEKLNAGKIKGKKIKVSMVR